MKCFYNVLGDGDSDEFVKVGGGGYCGVLDIGCVVFCFVYGYCYLSVIGVVFCDWFFVFWGLIFLFCVYDV